MRKLVIILVVFTHFPPGMLFGKEERNLLGNIGTIEFLQKNLVEGHSWVSFPSYSDREAWGKFPEDLRNSYILQGENI